MDRDPSLGPSDLARLRALAHPLRVRILEVIRTAASPLTVADIARSLRESPSNCSFHIRVLATGGLIERAQGVDKKHRPWRAVSTELEIDPLVGTAMQRSASRVAIETLREHNRQLLSNWDECRPEAPAEWKSAYFEKSVRMCLTARQLQLLAKLCDESIKRAAESPPGDEALETVQLEMIGFPIRSAWQRP